MNKGLEVVRLMIVEELLFKEQILCETDRSEKEEIEMLNGFIDGLRYSLKIVNAVIKHEKDFVNFVRVNIEEWEED